MKTNLRKFRESQRLTQAGLADALGVRQTTVSMWETDQRIPRTPMIFRIAGILGVGIEELFKTAPQSKKCSTD